MNKKLHLAFLLTASLSLDLSSSTHGAETNDSQSNMDEYLAIASSNKWQEKMADDGTQGDWKEKWILDSDVSSVKYTPEGMLLVSGPDHKDNGHSMVLWTKESYTGDLKVEYDFTRLDERPQGVNIIYIQATGKEEGEFTKDIMEWAHLRTRAKMPLYWKNMKLLHISYAVNIHGAEDEYIRARQYPVKPGGNFNKDTELKEAYFRTGLFKVGVPYRLTTIKRDGKMYFHVKGDGQEKVFDWDLANWPPLNEGRVGLRLMPARQSRFKDIKISLWNSTSP
jgi:hypothetical protein